ncbi:unnamed protein product [Closterium sp. NIES-53]
MVSEQPVVPPLAAREPPLQPARRPCSPLAAPAARSPPACGPLAAPAARSPPACGPLDACLRPTRHPCSPLAARLRPARRPCSPLAARLRPARRPLAARLPPLAARELPSGSLLAAPCSLHTAPLQPARRPLRPARRPLQSTRRPLAARLLPLCSPLAALWQPTRGPFAALTPPPCSCLRRPATARPAAARPTVRRPSCVPPCPALRASLVLASRPACFDTWLDELKLYLLSDSRDRVSLFDNTPGASLDPLATADSATRSQWLTRDAVACLAIRNHLPLAERAHFGQYKTAKALYDVVIARYSSPTTVALGCLILPYLFPELSAFATVEDLVTHLRTSDCQKE